MGSSGSSGYVPPDRGEPDLSVGLSDAEVMPGTIESLEFDIQNDATVTTGAGDGVTTARGVTVEIDDSGPFERETGPVAIGPIQDGESVPATQQLAVPDDLEAGEYDIRVEVSYSYNSYMSSDGSHTREQTTETETVTIEVPDEPRFEITDVDTDVEPGASGPATLEVSNVGTEWANETRASIAGGSGVTVDGGSADAPVEEIIGDIAPNESTTMLVDVAVAGELSSGERPLEIDFSYRDSGGVEREGESRTASLTPGAEQSFAIGDVTDTLSVGYDGHIGGEITNEGPRTIDDAVLVVEPMSESLYIEDTRYALPELEPGETTAFTYPTDVSGQADAGPRQLQFSVEYTGSSGDATLEDGPFTDRVTVDERTDEFALGDDGIIVEQGDRTEFELEITNQREETLSNIDAQLYTDSPLSTSNDEAFVPALEPGESTTITFDVAAGADATTEYHPVELDFQYDTESGDTVVSDVYQHPVEVVAGEDDDSGGITGTVVGLMALLSIAGLGIGMWWRRT
ncbi:hypothetical protein G6M89_11055 [Natronolimnobius sp. AArcel1]|nr:hypothetical protein [Natronolimnobius sp. AArcel1]NGM69535.1 hypothetical protein [Natronolimnobius sp. AArcel1]